jgi:hypothetical protein
LSTPRIARVTKEITFSVDPYSSGVFNLLKLKKGKLVKVVSETNDPRIQISFTENVESNMMLEKTVQERIFKEYFEIVPDPFEKKEVSKKHDLKKNNKFNTLFKKEEEV